MIWNNKKKFIKIAEIESASVGSGGGLVAQVGLTENVTFKKEYEIGVEVHPFAVWGRTLQAEETSRLKPNDGGRIM